jgi:hypothetical protein
LERNVAEGFFIPRGTDFSRRRESTDEDQVSWSDWGKAVGAGAVGVAGSLAGAAEYVTQGEVGGDTRRALGKVSEDIMKSTSPAMRQASDADFLPGGDNETVLDVGVGRSLGAKSMQALPSLIASLVPAGLAVTAARGVGAAAATRAAVGAGAARATAGVLNAGEVASNIFGEIEKLSDEQLADMAPAFAGYLSMGLSPEEARKRYKNKVAGAAPIIAGALSAALGGVEAGVGRRLGGEAAKGLIRGAGKGAAAEALQEAGETGGGEFIAQAQLSEAGLTEVDWRKILSKTIEGGAVGGVLGGGVGGVSNIGRRGKQAATPEIEIVDPIGPNTAETEALKASSPPAAAQTTPDVTPEVTPDATTSTTPIAQAAPDAAPAPIAPTPDVTPAAPTPMGEALAAPDPVQPELPAATAVEPEAAPEAAPALVPDVTTQGNKTVTPAPMVLAAPEAAAAPAEKAPKAAKAKKASKKLAEQKVAPAPAAEPVATPVAATEGPRVLQVTTPEVEAATKAANEKIAQNIAQTEKELAGPQGEKMGKAKRAKKDADAQAAKQIFDESPSELKYPETKEAKATLKSELAAILEKAKAADIKIPTKVGYETTADHIVWLREVQTLHDKLGSKSFVGSRARDHITAFLARTAAAKGGDFSVMRSERRAEGDAAKRRDQGSVEAKAAPTVVTEAPADGFVEMPQEATKLEADAVSTSVGKSARGAVRGLDDAAEEREVRTKDGKVEKVEGAKAASKGKVLSAEEKAEIARKLGLPVTPPERQTPVDKRKALDAVPETAGMAFNRAARQADTNPTEAQKKAGNYAKGHVRVQGLDIAIENPQGTLRRGKDRGGKEWSVRMPAHYGYIKRTAGADGDQVDIYVGPARDSDRVFVVDQVDANTRQFDEHKAMVGFRDADQARAAYVKGFSDGRGPQRMGAVTELSMDEFKLWLKNGDTRRPLADTQVNWGAADTAIEDDTAAAFESLTDDETLSKHERAKKYAINSGSLEAMLEIAGQDFAAWADDMALFASPGQNTRNALVQALAPQMRKKIAASAADVPVYILPDDAFELVSTGNPKAFGVFMIHENFIAIPERTARDPKKFAHTLMHEGAHAAFMRATWANTKIRGMVSRIAQETYDGIHPDDRGLYAFENVDEFIAEAFSNPVFQEYLASRKASPELAAVVGLKSGVWSMWDSFLSLVSRALGLPNAHGTLLHAMLKIGARLEAQAIIDRGGLSMPEVNERFGELQVPFIMREEEAVSMAAAINSLEGHLGETIGQLLNRPEMQEQRATPLLMKLRTMDQIAQAAGRYFRGNNPVRKIADIVEKRRIAAHSHLMKSEKVVAKLFDLERKYQGQQWEEFTSLVHDETMANVFADRDLKANKHLGKDTLSSTWSKAQHAALRARWQKLPADLKQARVEAMQFFTDQQNEMSLGIIKNRVLAALGIKDDALALRIHTDTLTPADEATLGDSLKVIQQAKELAKIKGPYFPLMRRGEHVVRATYKVTAPGNPPAGVRVTQREPNVFEFAIDPTAQKATKVSVRRAARAWAASQKIRADVRSIWVDRNTGSEWVKDPTTGKDMRITSKDIDAEQRYRVTVQNEHVEFFETKTEALRAAADLEASGEFAEVKGAEPRKYESAGRQGDMLSGQMRQLVDSLKKRKGYRGMTQAQQFELIGALNEASIRFLGSTRIQSKHLPRRYVAGASSDLTQNSLEYAASTANYLAKLEHMPELYKAMQEMDDALDADKNKEASYARRAIANEIHERVESETGFTENDKFSGVTKRLMTVSFLDKLFSPAYNIINSLQPTMVTYPVLAAKYGAGRSFEAMSKAYSDIAAFNVVKKGLRNTVARAKGDINPSDFISDMKAKMKTPGEREMLDYLLERGSIDPDSGLELAQFIKAKKGALGKFDKGVSYMEGIAREMPRAIETINRAVTALATYRLEMQRTGDQQRAMERAQEVVNNTQGLYSNTNAAPIFNHPLGKLSLQFKKYGQMMYYLLGQQIGKAVRNENEGDRAEALKTLGFISATHVAMAGALGLPTEPFKYLLMGAYAVGLPVPSWNDVEHGAREMAASMFGNTMGEVVTRGVTRAIPGGMGFDLSGRMGLDSLITFGEPRTQDEQGVWAYLGKTVAGAPAALVGDWLKGAYALGTGEFTKAAELMVPMKFAADSIGAYRKMTEGKKSASSGKETMSPYTLQEAGLRAVGFTPRREAETNDKRSAFYSKQKSNKDERGAMVRKWVDARPADKAKAFREIQKWNAGKPKDAQITMKQLTDSAKRRADDARKAVNGINARKSEKHFLDQTSIYNAN